MKMTSAEANKLLKTLNLERETILEEEKNAFMFLSSAMEDPESNRPEYNFLKVQEALKAVEDKIAKVKHAINLFNIETLIPGTGITLDRALIMLPQLNAEVAKLTAMAKRPPKKRVQSYHQSYVDYEYANYDRKEVKELLAVKQAELSELQLALDAVNVTKTFEVPKV